MPTALAGAKGRSEGLAFEVELIEMFNTVIPNVSHAATQSVASTSGGTCRSKTDILVDGESYSIKNPGKSSASIQIMVTALHKFLESYNADEDTRNAFKLFLGLSNGFGKLLKENKIKESDLNYNDELRRQRVKFSSLSQYSRDAILSFLNKNKRDIVDIVVRRGWADDSKDFANKMIWCDSSVHQKSDVEHLCLFDSEEVINTICEYDWEVRPRQTVLYLGPLTLQMKGSGKGEAYHYPQFNCSLNDLRRAEIVSFEGDYKQILNYMMAS